MTAGQPKESKGGKLSPGGDHGPQLSGSYWSLGVSKHNIWPPVKRLFGYIGRYRWAIVFGVSLAMISSLLSTIGPQYIRAISDMIFDGIDALKQFVRNQPEVDKDAILDVFRDLKSNDQDKVAHALEKKAILDEYGISMEQNDEFWIEPIADDQVK